MAAALRESIKTFPDPVVLGFAPAPSEPLKPEDELAGSDTILDGLDRGLIDSGAMDTLVSRLAPGGEIVLAGFYTQPLAFAFAPAFMREATIRCAAEWKKPDLLAVRWLIETGHLSLDGLITHHADAAVASTAYPVAFNDIECLKMVLDWRHCQ
jgi:2-desacetyl-2-hydroxyethyl bacteriochlorophyllide A dehydrogenase